VQRVSANEGERQAAKTRAAPPSPERFSFGQNWTHFLRHIDDERVSASERCLCEMLGIDNLAGKSFLDIGSGSGLSSLAARRLGASVLSFDYDSSSVSSTRQLRARFFPEDDQWRVEQGSVLDNDYISSLGQFDVVYSWGVLHHTGDLWAALERVAHTVKPGGKLFVAIYNDHGLASRLWRAEKRLYVLSPRLVRLVLAICVGSILEVGQFVNGVVHGHWVSPWRRWQNYKERRGMSVWHDNIDWVGGYPFEFARPGQVFSFLHRYGFELEAMTTNTGAGSNNQYVFRLPATP
jgi:2-polyprenyl-6-hydroxyphenyl methylase/3-demethylubiquinone-9 3-methyltransferase